ncbi:MULTISPECIES: type III pantothenate kinase [unclassified Massilia]|uniref:type III pantothenate kinase n=1 Tax=unclassified Massilia TaxID=2609279 RepID=UPI001783A79E|nr:MULTISPECIES: type III pantothenate kinase [unclassified Massilia]MBD8530610.1 type III pantothenate kinase [Massilia sp. CFBP 13647]MBD8674834.1 type III pantothenate kinase [Massilia sp. CFBP 13721]
MLLLIDAGNTRVKWALAAPGAAAGAWLACGAALHADLDAAAAAWHGQGVTHALVSNVAGAALRERLGALLAPIDTEWFASSAQRAGLVNGYREPERLGCDRFAAAIGARALAPGQALVVATAGTATTVDAVSNDGRFIGGMILPGLALMAGALAQNTAQLPQATPGAAPPPQFADNTNDAIVSGCLSAQAGAIERAVAQHGKTHSGALCILSGGAAPYIAPALTCAHRLVDNIVLVGLHAVALAETPMGDSTC